MFALTNNVFSNDTNANESVAFAVTFMLKILVTSNLLPPFHQQSHSDLG